MKGDVSLLMTSSSSEPSRAEDALLRDQPQLGSTEVCLWGEHGAGESFPVAQMVPSQFKPVQRAERRGVLLMAMDPNTQPQWSPVDEPLDAQEMMLGCVQVGAA